VFVVVRNTDVLVEEHDGALRLPPRAVVEPWAGEALYLGHFHECDCYGAPARADAEPTNGLRFSPARALFAELDEATLEIVGRAIAFVDFETTHRFCGRCASRTASGAAGPPVAAGASLSAPPLSEHARHCPNCGLTFYPRIPPAVIVLVERDGLLLLARSPRLRPGMFSAVAGFVEIGESLEQAAMREVKEEVGVDIADLRYFASQPWPFGRSLMVAFFAQHAGGDLAVDGTEIVQADWFALDRLPLLPPKISIARRMIDAFVESRR
jgi:NAD+ diphosphatase